MAKAPAELLGFFRRHDRAVKTLALALRDVVHEELAPCHEYIFAMRSKVVLLYGASEHVIEDGICQIHVFARHVNLSFPRGVELEVPADALAGTGKAMRHIALRTRADVERPDIRACLRLARAHEGAPPRRPGAAVITRVKSR